jgi:alanyl-tRNA synthetase
MPTAPTLTSTQVRQQFIDFFVDKAGHTAVPSAPVVPHDDPTLLFTNAGMNQFKDVFLGTGKRDYTRAVDTQKCIRAGGKHNDLDDVGKDTYHHTFFEMLGNWSFGDYFKKEAIAWAWELLVDQWGLDPERLYATYFEGDEAEGLEPDYEARDFWLHYLPTERVQPGNKKDNFWEMGDTGPCGPCSELHYDRSPDKSGGGLVNADGQDTVVEIWNLVFIQFNRNQDGSLSPLPAKHVDTGMGFERIVRVLQGKDSNYDTDVFAPIFAAIQDVTGARAYLPGAGEAELKDPINIAYRVIADHIRTLVFALSDGAHCGNEGRNYVLRSILRRAVRFGKQTLGMDEPFFYKLVPTVVEHFGDTFPEIKAKQDAVAKELREEEQGFRKTLDRGIGLFEQVVTGLAGDAKRPVFPGEDAFKLHDTYGFPIGLTQLMAEERGLTVDLDGFEREMEAARERSRGGDAGSADVKALLTEWVQKNDAPATEFVGYDATEGGAKVLHVVDLGEQSAVVLDRTPFYAEQGGQVGDSGEIIGTCITTWESTEARQDGKQERDPFSFYVEDTQKIAETYFHIGRFPSSSTVRPGKMVFITSPTSVDGGQTDVAVTDANVRAEIDLSRRTTVTANHTITHVMNRALRDRVSTDAAQKGSLVDDEKTRFDFSHNAALTPEQLEAVEKQVNDDIAADLPVYTGYAPQDEALKINGLRAVFGEKYPPTVRVVSIGAPVEELLVDPSNARWGGLSIEFCGGTHLKKTGEAEGFVILSQDAVSKGVRRITAVTGAAAHKASAEGEQLLSRVETLRGAPVQDLDTKVEQLVRAVGEQPIPLVLKQKIQAGIADLSRRVKEYAKAEGSKQEETVIESARVIADGEAEDAALIVAEVPGADAKTLRTAMDVIRKKRPGAAMLLAAAPSADKVALLASVPKEVIAKGLKAGDWVKHTAPVVGGGGGGRPDMAQAGGKDASKLAEALDAARTFASEKL